MCVLGVNPGEGQKQKGYRAGERGRHKADPVITDLGLVVRLTLNPHTQHRRMRHPGSSQNLSSAPPASTRLIKLIFSPKLTAQ